MATMREVHKIFKDGVLDQIAVLMVRRDGEVVRATFTAADVTPLTPLTLQRACEARDLALTVLEGHQPVIPVSTILKAPELLG